jgi:hypothetical protein
LARFSGGVPLSVSQAVRVRCARANAPVPESSWMRTSSNSTPREFTRAVAVFYRSEFCKRGKFAPWRGNPSRFYLRLVKGLFGGHYLLSCCQACTGRLWASRVICIACPRQLSLVAELLEVAVGMLVFQIDWKARLDCDCLWIASTNNPRSISWWSSSDDLANEA